MKWHVHSERQLYHDQWIDLRCAEVELDDGRRLDHRFINVQAGAGAVVLNAHDEVQLLWRHRFITDAWNYEIPMGAIEPGEDPMTAAARETEEETGWRPGPMRFLLYDEPMNGLLNTCNHIYLAEAATYIGPAKEGFESDRVEWVPLAKLPDLIRDRQVIGGTTIATLLMAARERGV